MKNIFFDSWESVIRIIIITILAYATLIVMLRVSGKRTLSKMNAFDFVVTVALGSTLATVILSKDVALLDGALAFFMLIFLQYCITWLSVRHKGVKQMITSDPTLLLYKGEVLPQALKKERITVEEIYVAARNNGLTDLTQIHAIVLETTGTLSVLSERSESGVDALSDIENHSFKE
ncbi:DUF421 domain-containing protein [Salmonirosea aquatica]|uniref:DUF421 domain-containing protein n=1 Tax=Salmonirosea aquatica TaxID=2654236 RepID=A0A7C9FB67_9BACT|nr:DUF421 domain-containing protein [Cytophagaceae bacterium SJW1-29]